MNELYTGQQKMLFLILEGYAGTDVDCYLLALYIYKPPNYNIYFSVYDTNAPFTPSL